MNLRQRLLNKYGINQPILLSEVRLPGVSSAYIRKELPQMVRRGEIERFSRGIYYFAEETPYGKLGLFPSQVCRIKYVQKGPNIIGFYSGLNLQNQLSISTQVPFTSEVTTNKVGRRVSIKIDNQRFNLIPPRVKITNWNVATLKLLDVIEKISLGSFEKEDIEILTRFIQKNRITKAKILKIIRVYPKDTLSKLQETGLFSVLA